MHRFFHLILLSSALILSCTGKEGDYTYKGVPLESVRFSGGLLAERGKVVRENTLPFAFRKCEETGRIANFARAAGLDSSEFTGLRYDDSDVYKVMEAASYALACDYDPVLDHYMDSLIALVAAAQEPDGYLYTIRTSGCVHVDEKAGSERWSNIFHSHELYNVGHMYEAAVAHYHATGKTDFLDIAKRNADLLYDTFLKPGRKIVSGHEEIETALVRLYRATGDKRYLDLAYYLLECRGGDGEITTYRQNHKKVTEQYEAVGHAVRAVYLYMAMADIAALRGDAAYRTAIDSLWNDVVGRKMHLHGGIGSHLSGESFGEAWYLPDSDTHCETCASVGNCMWNYRMFCLTGEGRYFDVFERTLYNSVLHGLSDDGMLFFYANVLQCSPETYEWQREWLRKKPSSGLRRTHRRAWFETSCCPTNLARFILSLPSYTYATGCDGVYVNLFESGQGAFETADGEKIELSCKTSYPADGAVRLTVEKAPRKSMALRIRIPGWACGHPVPSGLYSYSDDSAIPPEIKVNGVKCGYETVKGYAVLDRKWKDGDVVELTLDMPVRFVRADSRAETLAGRCAVERGPFVYCTSLPLSAKDIRSLEISVSDNFVAREKSPGIVSLTDTDRNIEFLPYYRHAQEGETQMSVWIYETH